jgi:dolichol kinase
VAVLVDLVIEFNDIVVFLIGLIYVLIVLGTGDLVRRKLKKGSNFTRKIIHLFAGAAVWTVPYYPHPWVATLLAFTFVLFLAVANSQRFGRFFAAMARPEDLEHGSVRGPFWYAVSITLLTALFTFTDYQRLYFVAAAAIQIMMFGDGMSAPVGLKYGKNHMHTIFGSKRSTPGSSALFVFGFLGAMLAFWFFGAINYGVFVSGSQILWMPMIYLALIAAIVATLVELVSPKGTDNVTLPFITCLVVFLIGMQMGLVVL